MIKTLRILGSTGSVGANTIDLVKSSPDKFKVDVLTAHSRVDVLADQCLAVKPAIAVIGDERKYADLKSRLAGTGIEAAAGEKALLEASSRDVDWTMAAIVGMAGLKPLMNAIASSRTVAIANKEPLVAAGPFVLEQARRNNTALLPVDSEHNAIFQVFDHINRKYISRLILTASGGPFRDATIEEMKMATPAQAVAHPNWSMGAKISVDSATMMNKALEVIEAHYLFNMPDNKIDILVHPQSIVHSMVEYEDGSVLAQLGAPDMRTPIAYTLAWPERMATTGQKLDFTQLARLDFKQPDLVRFPVISMAYDCLRQGLGATLALNAANEVAVESFLAGSIGFMDISKFLAKTIENSHFSAPQSLDEVIEQDNYVRMKVQSYML